ncbi:MAG: prolyl oligopeptidase family serine peptidase [Planctomycetota bacterium]|nr:prolyl oligopeptidase family serine peptidase [Planctomycetota bacterium]
MHACTLLPPILCLVAAATAQGTAADYQRAERLGNLYRGKVDAGPRKVHWTDDSQTLWFSQQRDGATEFVRIDIASGERTTATSAAALGLEDRSLEALAGDARSRGRGAETHITFENRFDRRLRVFWVQANGALRGYGEIGPNASHEQHTFAGHAWRLLFDDDSLAGVFRASADGGTAVIDESSRDRAQRPRRGRRNNDRPRGNRNRVFVRDDNVWLRTDDGPIALTTNGRADDAYRGDLHVSPDGRFLLCFQQTPAEPHEIPLIESRPKDQVQPKLHSLNYRKPGDRLAKPRPRLFDLQTQQAIEVAEEPFADPWSIGRVHWAADSSEVHVLYNRRGHQQLSVFAIDAKTGAVRTVVEERPETFVDYSQKTWMQWLDATNELLWASERSGHNHIYLVDVPTGAIRPVTQGDWVVRRVNHVDPKTRELWFTAYGIHPDQDPYHAHLARAAFDGQGLQALTASDGTHEWEFSPNRQHLVATWSRVDHPRVTELRRCSDGELVCELGRDDASRLLEAGFRMPQRFVAKGRDGKTDIHGIILRPSNFDPTQRYPVIESIYAGPHGFHVPKSFGTSTRRRQLAELGFVVVQIDGMGTNWRSKAFHDVCWRNLKDAGFPDRIAWLRAAAEQHPELDLTRVGIYGGSAGGQNALAALLHHGDFYQAAAADCGCHDNRMDKIWWNEAWMGWPIGDWYADSSNVTHAHKLRGKLLLTVGELDRNVDPTSTLQVVDALIKADKDFDFVLVPGAGHGIGEGSYLRRRRMDFFVRSLWGVEPRRATD